MPSENCKPQVGCVGGSCNISLDSTLNPILPLVADEAINFHPVVGFVVFCGQCQARVTNPRSGVYVGFVLIFLDTFIPSPNS